MHASPCVNICLVKHSFPKAVFTSTMSPSHFFLSSLALLGLSDFALKTLWLCFMMSSVKNIKYLCLQLCCFFARVCTRLCCQTCHFHSFSVFCSYSMLCPTWQQKHFTVFKLVPSWFLCHYYTRVVILPPCRPSPPPGLVASIKGQKCWTNWIKLCLKPCPLIGLWRITCFLGE